MNSTANGLAFVHVLSARIGGQMGLSSTLSFELLVSAATN